MIQIPIDVSLVVTIVLLFAGLIGIFVILLGLYMIKIRDDLSINITGIIIIILGIGVIFTVLSGFGIDFIEVIPI